MEEWDFIDIVFDLSPGTFQQLVALCSGDAPLLSRKGETSSVGLALQDHSLEGIDAIGGL